MIHVITPNTQERTKIMAITSIIYSMGYTVNNVYYPFMVDVLCDNGDKYNLRYFRGAYTPMALLMPLVLLAFFGTQERLVLPKSRIAKVGLVTSVRAVAGNKIFWIRCADSWNNFLEDAKGNIWDWLVYRAHIMKSTTYGLLNTVSYNANFWGMLSAQQMEEMEYGVRVVATISNWAVVNNMEVGLYSNASISYSPDQVIGIAPACNASQINHILETLAGLELKEKESIYRTMERILESDISESDILVFSTFWNDSLESRADELRRKGNSVTHITLRKEAINFEADAAADAV